HTTYYASDSRDDLVAVADANGPPGPAIARRAFANGPRTVNTTNLYGNVTVSSYDGLGRRTSSQQVLTASARGDGTHLGTDVYGVRTALPTPDPAQGGGDGLITLTTSRDANSLPLSRTDDHG